MENINKLSQTLFDSFTKLDKSCRLSFSLAILGLILAILGLILAISGLT